MRRSSFPPKLQKFVDTVEEKAQVAGHSATLARIFGAWAACFVRFCTVHDRSWREAEHVPAFLEYLGRRDDIDEASRKHAAKALAFLFERLLKANVSGASWHPDQQSSVEDERTTDETTEGSPGEEGEQSTLLTRLLFHTSLPINEALDLCAGDVDLDGGLIYVSDPMGTPKRIIELPDTLHDPLRRHLKRLRQEHGRRYFDAPLFQARAIQGRVNEEEPSDSDTEEDDSDPVPAAESAEDEDRPASLWGYANES